MQVKKSKCRRLKCEHYYGGGVVFISPPWRRIMGQKSRCVSCFCDVIKQNFYNNPENANFNNVPRDCLYSAEYAILEWT